MPYLWAWQHCFGSRAHWHLFKLILYKCKRWTHHSSNSVRELHGLQLAHAKGWCAAHHLWVLLQQRLQVATGQRLNRQTQRSAHLGTLLALSVSDNSASLARTQLWALHRANLQGFFAEDNLS